MKSKHQQVLERDLALAETVVHDAHLWAEALKKSGNLSEASVYQREADEAQERAEAIRHALEIMRKAETLPKTADGVTVWPIDWVWVWDKEKDGTITTSRVSAHENWSFTYLCYSTQQAARDAAREAK